MNVARLPFGEAAWLLRFSPTDPASGEKVRRAFHALRRSAPAAVCGLHPAYASLLVEFDPARGDAAELARWIDGAIDAPAPPEAGTVRRVEIPVRYGDEEGPDLQTVAHAIGATAEEVIAAHTAAVYRVAFLGFRPGFAYLEGLPPFLHVPRLRTPRPRVPPGSVAIAGRQTGVYPLESPGGWNIIGRTSLPLFCADADPPARLAVGDEVVFRRQEGKARER